VLKCLSVKIIVIPAAKAGRAATSSTDVIKTLQTKSGNLNKERPAGLMLTMVTIIFNAPSIEEAPAKCMLKIAKSTAAPG